ncbi:uncharacterized protein LOC126902790 [Daktulosphaira vitifoliae]|uniref:uncharacterized protein LOC126902790 n=1 Tax=Daktulosphaira vitifoliae TaxID=58002 RepID=UPI0021A98328|nr:uncharacterized protein LOC126902790 [Daktulosphaira vitifoliae]
MYLLTVLIIFAFSKAENTTATGHNLHCVYSQYLLRFFQNNKISLNELEKNVENVTKEDLRIFDKAIRTHDIVVLAFLENLASLNYDVIPYDLFLVNMYINNGSKTTLLNAFCNDTDKKTNWIYFLIQGFQIMHRSIIEHIKHHVDENCMHINYSIQTQILNIPIELITYTPTDLLEKNLQMKVSIMNTLKLTSNIEILVSFDPEKYFYSNMYGQKSKNNNNYISTLHQRIENLNIFRLALINEKCYDGRYVNLIEVFNYIKYNINIQDLKLFQKMTFAALFRPVAIIIRNFIKTATVYYSVDSLQNSFTPFKDIIIEMGNSMMHCLNKFIEYTCNKKIYDKSNKNRGVRHFFEVIYELIYKFFENFQTSKIKTITDNVSDKLLEIIEKLMTCNKLKFSLKLKFDESLVTKQSFKTIIEEATVIQNNVNLYIDELKSWRFYLSDILYNHSLINSLFVLNNNLINETFLKNICKSKFHSDVQKLMNHEEIKENFFIELDDNNNNFKTIYINQEFKNNIFVKKELQDDEFWSNELLYAPKYKKDYYLKYVKNNII